MYVLPLETNVLVGNYVTSEIVGFNLQEVIGSQGGPEANYQPSNLTLFL